jgi:hypothetical protein
LDSGCSSPALVTSQPLSAFCQLPQSSHVSQGVHSALHPPQEQQALPGPLQTLWHCLIWTTGSQPEVLALYSVQEPLQLYWVQQGQQGQQLYSEQQVEQ